MKKENQMKTSTLFLLGAVLFSMANPLMAYEGINAVVQDDMVWKKNFGNSAGMDDYTYFNSVIAVSDGSIAVGYTSASSFGKGDWAGVTGKGDGDAIIVKYDKAGSVVWKKNFGGQHNDEFHAVTEVPGGVVAVGFSMNCQTGDWADVEERNNFAEQAIIVKFDHKGNVVWKNYFGGRYFDKFNSVVAVSDGIIAVGNGCTSSYQPENSDLFGLEGRGSNDAIIVKYDFNGNVRWKKNFGGGYWDDFRSVTVVPGGVVAVGVSDCNNLGSFEDGLYAKSDWAGIKGKNNEDSEDRDAIIVKFDNAGNVVWKKLFGGKGRDEFNSVTAISDGIIAVGYSQSASFGAHDWAGVAGKGKWDAILVKYDFNGNMVWKRNFGGSNEDAFHSVATVSDGFVAAGFSVGGSFGTGDWAGFKKLGQFYVAVIVKFDNKGNAVWKKNFADGREYKGVAVASDGVIATGCFEKNGIVVKYTK